MTSDRGANQGEERPVSRDEIDRLIDRELSSEERRALVNRLRHDAGALDEVVEMRQLSGRFRQPVGSPDFTARVLHDVDRRRGFLSSRLRRRVKQGRAVVAASALLALFSLAVAHRMNPDAFRLHDAPTPVADLGNAVVQDSIESRRVLADAVRGFEPVELVDEDAGGSGSLGLAEFHVPLSSVAVVPDEAPEQYIVLTACADPEMLALGGSRAVFASIEMTSVVAGDSSFPVSEVTWASPRGRGYASMAVLTMRLNSMLPPDAPFRVEAGVAPMSLMPAYGSAYVGRHDPFRDGSLEYKRVTPQPAVPSRVSNQSDEH